MDSYDHVTDLFGNEVVERRPDFSKGPLNKKITSDGGSAQYYVLPEGAKELNDLIETKAMSFARANIFKAVYRMGEKTGVDVDYDINKVILFAERLRGMARKGIPL